MGGYQDLELGRELTVKGSGWGEGGSYRDGLYLDCSGGYTLSPFVKTHQNCAL